MATLELQESAVGAPNYGSHTLAAALLDTRPVLVRPRSSSSLPPPPDSSSPRQLANSPLGQQVAAVGARVDLLDENCKLVQALPLEHAFPGRTGDDQVEAVAVDGSSSQVRPLTHSQSLRTELTPRSPRRSQLSRAAVSRCGRPGEAAPGGSTRALSSSTMCARSTSSKVRTRSLVHPRAERKADAAPLRSAGHLVVAGDGVSLWSLDQASALPTWNKIGFFSCVPLTEVLWAQAGADLLAPAARQPLFPSLDSRRRLSSSQRSPQ